MRKKAALLLASACLVGAVAFMVLSAPQPFNGVLPPGYQPDVANGKVMYDAGGCISCHKPDKGQGDASLPSGGAPLPTPIGVFYPPNITGDKPSGIGDWSDGQFVNAMMAGVSPDGQHYFPAFPFTSYARMKITDVLDLKAYLMSLKNVDASSHKTTSLFGAPLLRRGLGLWKRLNFERSGFVPDKTQTPEIIRGAYLVAGPGHCNECHTPRNISMGLDFSRHLAGGPHPEGKGKVPSLRGLKERKRFSSVDDLNSALRFGEILGYEDMSSGGMGDVQTNMSKLPETDSKAIAAYLFSLK